jgi:hypothetical protein
MANHTREGIYRATIVPTATKKLRPSVFNSTVPLV